MSKKQKIIVSALLIAVILSMCLPWFGGARKVQEIRGTIVLLHPITICCIVLSVAGIWASSLKYANALATTGLCGMIGMELHYFLTWHIQTVSGKFSVTDSFHLAYPEFYVGLGLTVLTFLTYIIFLNP